MKRLWLGLVFALALTQLSLESRAHSYLDSSVPKANQTVRVMPKTLQLSFTEPLEVGFSLFKVYALPKDMQPQQLVSQVLSRKDDADARADAGLVSMVSPASRLELKLKDNLQMGQYVVMWRVLSVDTHTSEGYFVFRYAK